MATRKSKAHPENRASKQRAAAQEGRSRAAEPLDDMLVARQPLVGMLQQDIEQLLGATFSAEPGGLPPLTLEGAQRPQHWATRGMRHFLNEPEDSGYWDFFKISDGFLLSITDAQYRKDTWVRVDGTAFFNAATAPACPESVASALRQFGRHTDQSAAPHAPCPNVVG